MGHEMKNTVLSKSQKQQFDQDGYVIVKGLLSAQEVEVVKNEFMKLHAAGPIPKCFSPVSEEEAKGDILKQYPRMMHPHRVNEVAMKYMLHPTVMDVLEELFEEEALATQSMFYFKPPGARGQALHQDNFYLKVEPDTCIAAWTAIDRADEENGGIMLVPKTNELPIECPQLSDRSVSFTKDEVPIPAGMKAIPAILDPGDVLFFNGSVIHGSYPNQSTDRFRRSFISHYCGISTTRIGQYYNPLYTRDGTPRTVRFNLDSGPCGEEFEEAAGPH